MAVPPAPIVTLLPGDQPRIIAMPALPITPIRAILALIPVVVILAVTVVNALPRSNLSKHRYGVASIPMPKASARNVRIIRIIFFSPATTSTSQRNGKKPNRTPSRIQLYSTPPAPRCLLRSVEALTEDSPVEETSSAPVRSRISLARFTSSDEAQCTDKRMPPF